MTNDRRRGRGAYCKASVSERLVGRPGFLNDFLRSVFPRGASFKRPETQIVRFCKVDFGFRPLAAPNQECSPFTRLPRGGPKTETKGKGHNQRIDLTRPPHKTSAPLVCFRGFTSRSHTTIGSTCALIKPAPGNEHYCAAASVVRPATNHPTYLMPWASEICNLDVGLVFSLHPKKRTPQLTSSGTLKIKLRTLKWD